MRPWFIGLGSTPIIQLINRHVDSREVYGNARSLSMVHGTF